MTDPISAIIDGTLAKETGKFTNNPDDAGGPTKWGVTQAELADFRGRPVSAAEVESLTQSDAWSVLYAKFVRVPKFDLVSKLSMPIAAKLIDAGVVCGPPTVSMWLQRCLNAFSLRGTKYPIGKVDGAVGSVTLAALGSFLTWRGKEGEGVLLEALRDLEGEHFIEVEEKHQNDADFVYGWIAQRVESAPAA